MSFFEKPIFQVLKWVILFNLLLLLAFSFFQYETPDILVWSAILLTTGVFINYIIKNNLSVYVGKRVLEGALVLWVIATLTFAMLRFIPGGPFDEEKALPPEVKANIEAKYHLDKPMYQQYFIYLKGILQGDLGESYKYVGRNVTEIIKETLPNSVQLGIYALIICYVLGIITGVLSAAYHNKWQDQALMFSAISGVSLPNFVLASVLVFIFCFELKWLPPALWNGPEYYILPMLTLGIRPAALIARLTRASVLEVIHEDYIRTAKAKGLPRRTILFKHVLKNSLIPVLTFSGPLISGVLTGSFIIELIFAIPGMGKHLIQSVTNRDYPLILGVTLLFSAVLIIANLIVDLFYTLVDPRIKMS